MEKDDDILRSRSFDHHYTVTTDNEGYGVISFGNGVFGQRPPDGCEIKVSYSIGCGTAGNMGRIRLRSARKGFHHFSNKPPAARGGMELRG